MTDELTIVHVAENALIEFIEQVARGRATNISVNKADAGWTVTYKAPFTREMKECSDAPCTPQMIAEADCDGDKAKCGDAWSCKE